jgi:uncharacterized protein YukE
MARTLATQEALQAIKDMKSIVEGGLAESITNLNNKGQFLSQPDQWDGPRAQQFRSDWQQMYQSLQKAKEAVEQLRAQADQITQDIMRAGGF